MGRRLLWSKDGTRFIAGDGSVNTYAFPQSYMDAVDDAETFTKAGTELIAGLGNHSLYIHYLLFNFPNWVTLDELRIAMSGFQAANRNHHYFEIQACPTNNTTTGNDGSWVTIAPNTYIHNINTNHIFTCTPTSTRWMRIKMTGYNTTASYDMFDDMYFYYLHLYGEYDTATYVLYDTQGTPQPINDWRQFLSAPSIAYDDQDFSFTKQFQIKNTDIVPHTYTITAQSGDYPFTDTLITNTYRLTSVSNPTPVASFTTPSVAVNDFSEVINVDYLLTAAANPINGKHFFRIVIKENT